MLNNGPTESTTTLWAEVRPSVLVIDDDPQVRDVVRAGLLRHGFEVQVAGDGQQGIELYQTMREHHIAGSPLVLLDVRMPGLDGPMVLEILREIDHEVKAYFMTGDPGK